MSTITCRLLSFAVADGAANMAADEVLLESAGAGVASLRFYGWSTATVSLGYFQPEKLRTEDPLLASLPYVRRPSGGMTLVHHHELTYALGLPAGPPWQMTNARFGSWLCRMHTIIAGALSGLGIISRAAARATEPPGAGALCFRHVTPGDLLVDSAKVAGSAQRRQKGALLQHGAILLAASPHAPNLPGIQELCGRSPTTREVQDAVASEWSRQTEWDLVAGDWSRAERLRIETLHEKKYASLSWNQRR